MQKQLTQLEHKIGEKIYHFMCDPASPLDHVKEALFQFIKYVGAVEDAIKSQQAAQAQQKPTEPQVEQPLKEAA